MQEVAGIVASVYAFRVSDLGLVLWLRDINQLMQASPEATCSMLNTEFLMDKLAHNESDVCTNEILRLVAAIWSYKSELLHKFKVVAMIAAVCDESTASRAVEAL